MKTATEYAIAKFVQLNNEKEADAIKDYSAFLESVAISELSEEEKEYIKSTIDEIISDELNHQEKLQKLYTEITGIEPNKD